jgi:hypothetical protein
MQRKGKRVGRRVEEEKSETNLLELVSPSLDGLRSVVS